MQSKLPEELDFIQTARKGSEIQGNWPVKGMKRLTELLLDDSGMVEASLRFKQEGRLRHVSGTVSAQVNVTCQRCMQAMPLLIETEFNLALVSDESKADQLPDGFEPLILDEDNRLNIPHMLEEELLLVMPIVAMHESDDCSEYLYQQKTQQQTEAELKQEKDNPFSVLKKLL